MSTKALTLAVLLTVALVAAALLLTRPAGQGPAPPTTQPRTLSAADVNSIALSRPERREERVVRNERGEWEFVSGSARWPANPPETVAAALAALPAELAKPAVARVEPGGPTITLGLRGGGACTIHLAPSSLGGRTAAIVLSPEGESQALLENSVLDPLINPGPAGWRVPVAIPGAAGASRVTLDDGATSVSLAKLEGQWGMRRPIAARASEGAVATLLESLAAIPVARFEDQATPDLAAMGLTKPALTITTETDERSADAGGAVRVRAITRELIVGGPADPRGDTRFAATDREGSIVMVVPASAVSVISFAPRQYLHPTVSAVPPAEIAIVTISDVSSAAESDGTQRGYRREAGGWVRLHTDGSRTPTEGGAVDELLEFLHARPGEPEPFRPDDDIRALRRIELLDPEGDAREVLTAGYTADGMFAVRSGNLLVTFRAIDAPALLEMPAWDSLPPEPGSPPRPPLPSDAPTGK